MEKLSCIVVDDETFNIRLLTDYIRNCDELHLVKTFDHPVAAKEFLQGSVDVDILFSDVGMPEISGLTLSEAVESKVKHIVFVTSHFQKDLHPDLKKWHYLSKPVRLETFRQLMQILLTENT